jgi:hypothetical protein
MLFDILKTTTPATPAPPTTELVDAPPAPPKTTGSILIPLALQPPAPLSPELVDTLRATADAEAARIAEWAATAQSVNAVNAADAAIRKEQGLAAGASAASAEILALRRRTAAALLEQIRGI